MIKQVINIEDYWKIIVYYNVDYNLFDYIADDISFINNNKSDINRIYNTMKSHKAKAVTLSSEYLRISIVLFNSHKSFYDYINSIVHEAEHIKQAMLKAYDVEDYGEPPAYTVGHIVMKMLNFKILKMLRVNYL